MTVLANRRPVVLVPPDLEEREGRRGLLRFATLQRQYAEAILDAGGLPFVPPVTEDAGALDDAIAAADALVLPGGAFDVDPALYGEARLEQCGELKPERTNLERALLARAERRGLPVLGVCGGMQLMNVMRGGTLWQDLDSQRNVDGQERVDLRPEGASWVEGPASGFAGAGGGAGDSPSSNTSIARAQPRCARAIDHQKPGGKHLVSHGVRVVAGTRLAALVGAERLGVNSTHHQGVKALAAGLVATASSDDGLVEAFEDPRLPYFVGVQWHPESMVGPSTEEPARQAHRAIYRALVEAARARRV